MKLVPVLVLLFSLGFTVTARAAQENESGWGGYAGFLFAYTDDHSNTDPDNDNQSEWSLDKSSGYSPMLLGEVNYTFGEESDHQVYFGLDKGDLIEGTTIFQLGYKTELEDGSVIGVSYLPSVGVKEVYSDPYASVVDRKKTKVQTQGVRLMGEHLFGTPISLEAAFAETWVDDELSGQHLTDVQRDLLKRDAKTYGIKGSFVFIAIDRVFLEQRVSYIRSDAEGEANTFHDISAGLSLHTFIERHKLSVSLDYAKRNYGVENPIYSTIRSDDSYDATVVYQYENMFDWDDWTFLGTAGYGIRDSNINFFNEKNKSIGVGMIYQF